MNIPRKHHYIPHFYLAGFTNSGKKDDKLWVLDQATLKQFKASPSSVGCEHDFYRLDLPDQEPDAFEKMLGKIEDMTAPVIRKMDETRSLPTGSDYDSLMYFVALMFARGPDKRALLDKFTEDVAKQSLRLICDSKTRYEDYVAHVRTSGTNIDDISYEQMIDFLNRDEFDINLDRNTHLKNTLHFLDSSIPLLSERSWILLVNENEHFPFICSDNPFSLVWTMHDNGFWGPGLGLRDTEVSLPISKQLMLVGRFDGQQGTVRTRSLKLPAIYNSRTGMYSVRFIYSTHSDFVWLMKDKRNGFKKDLLRNLVDSRTQKTNGI